ncbi:MAG: Structural maintenance of chromosomes protein 6, partial [Watsoniomyces obsoletus]
MPALLKAIQQERRFQASPVGPIGKHIKLLQPEWSSILEKAFGSTLNGFVVTNKRDQDLMVDLQKKFGIPPNVFIVGSAPIDTRSQEPDESFLSISRALDIDNVLVRNLLDPVLDWSGPVRMNSNVDDQIRVQQGVLNDTKAHLIDLEEALRSGRDALIKVKQEKTRYSTTATALRVALQEAEDRVETLQEAISEDNVKSGNLDVLRQILAEAKQQQERHEGSYMDAATDFEEKKRN